MSKNLKYKKETDPNYIFDSNGCVTIGSIIDTGIACSSNLTWQFKATITGVTPGVIFGGNEAGDSEDYRLFNYSSSIYFDMGKARINGSSMTSGSTYEWEVGNYYVKDLTTKTTLVSGSSQSYSSVYHFKLCGYSKIYYFKIYNGDTLVRDYVACIRKSDNKPGLYDKKNNTFVETNSTAEGLEEWVNVNQIYYKIEQRLPAGYTELNYIQSTGTQYISLPYGADKTDVIKFTHCLTDSSENDAYLLAASTWNEGGNKRFGMGRYNGYSVGSASSSHAAAFGASSTGATGLFLSNGTTAVAYDFTNMYEWEYSDSVFKVSALEISRDVSNITFGGTTPNLQLCKDYNGCRKGKVGHFYQKKSDGRTVDAYPAKRNSDNVIGMYDVANNVFYTNQGTGVFTAGEETKVWRTIKEVWKKFGERAGLPSEYTQIEYLTSTGTQYIDTGAKNVNGYDIRFKFNSSSDGDSVIGARNDAEGSNKRIFIMNYSNLLHIFPVPIGSESVFGDVDTEWHNVSLINGKFIIDKYEVGSQSSTPSGASNCNFYLFAANWSGNVYGMSKCSIEYVKLYRDDSETPFAHFVPCKNSAGVYGMYDIINGDFYENDGTGSFSGGDDIGWRKIWY